MIVMTPRVRRRSGGRCALVGWVGASPAAGRFSSDASLKKQAQWRQKDCSFEKVRTAAAASYQTEERGSDPPRRMSPSAPE